MTKKSKHLGPLADLVATGKTVRAAAEIVGCSDSQAYRISQTDEFKDHVSRIRTSVTEQLVGKITGSAAKAVEVLGEIMEDPDQKGSDRVSAAGKILSQIGPMMELHELRRRVEELEAKSDLGEGDDVE